MAQSLVIVESPAKAKTIGKFLGKGYKIAASMGHVRDLPKSQLGVDIDNNYEPKYITIRGKGKLLEELKKEAKKCDKVFLATDPDREGEAISWHLATILGLNFDEECRIEFHEITKKALSEAIKHPRRINMNLVNAQQARRVLDRLVGYEISPILWKKIKWGLSAGRVQSVAVKLICEREQEIKNFIPEEYWSITAKLKNKNKQFEAKFYGKGKEKIELKNKEQVDEILHNLKDSRFIVSNIKKQEKKKSPMPPFTTSTLQQEAFKKLNFTTKKTMSVAQQLYEGIDISGEGTVGLITYMRTDSVRVSEEAQKEAREYITTNFGLEYVPKTIKSYKTKGNAQDAHEAIRPTSVFRHPDAIKDSLTNDQYKLYSLIWNRFIASQMSDAVYDTTSVDITAGDYLFKVSGSILKFNGYLSVYQTDDEEQETKLPELQLNDILTLVNIDSKQHFTQPPSRYTEATLVKVLEEKGIGRPSTYAPIISTILERGYVEKDKKFLVPTDLGIIVTELLNENFKDIVDVEFTAEMEKKLDQIEEGVENWVEVVDSFFKPLKRQIELAEQNISKITLEEKVEVTDVICEKCGRNMVVKKSKYGKFLACPGYPECKNTKPIVDEIDVNCPLCGGKVVIKKSKKGKVFYGCSNFPECNFVSWDKPTNEKCPKCGQILYEKNVKGEKKLVCINKNCK
ncbi:type I DNA topoisomerase [Thermobrachium celere]|uniref:DNA topoisomerase 1 n=1 Tax=Thermobrachium celere DSM 8682 TaxID=941824 RepID=R7RRE8_9CLOT|nr:type I DNA topoisomerase [Thermobrachium celere]CDF57931.1 DNA topoisomerase I [Thermobrachium celere DSM 8682]